MPTIDISRDQLASIYDRLAAGYGSPNTWAAALLEQPMRGDGR